jgi:hypothetical protein
VYNVIKFSFFVETRIYRTDMDKNLFFLKRKTLEQTQARIALLPEQTSRNLNIFPQSNLCVR